MLDILKSFKKQLNERLCFIADSRQMKTVRSAMEKYSADRLPLAVVGPEGSGRTRVAETTHLLGTHWWRPCIKADMSTLNVEEATKLLYGYKEEHILKGSEIRPGLLELAADSTLCLKNIDRYHVSLQEKICNILLTKKYKAVGNYEDRSVMARFIFVLQFAPDDLLTINQIPERLRNLLMGRVIEVPPLSKRKEDIIPLARYFMEECSQEMAAPVKKISREAERWLKKAPWNKNVSQLKKAVYCACMNTYERVLYPHHFALAHEGNLEGFQQKQLEELSLQQVIEMKIGAFLSRLGRFDAEHLHEAIMGRVEEPLLRLVLSHTRGNQIKASRMLGINRNTLRSKLKRYSIKPARREAK